MGVIVFLVVLWIVISLVRGTAKKVGEIPTQLPPDFFGTHALPPEHVIQLGTPAAVLPAQARGEESTSELMWDDTASDAELNLDHAEVVSLEPADLGRVPARAALPGPAVTLEAEVDWEAEHQRFHQRYVDVRPASRAAARGLLDELRDPASTRRAVLMAEILGPPVSMRGQR